MSKGETWKCDGKRKDGGTHPNLSCTGQNDEIDINDECECGLTNAQIHPNETSTTTIPAVTTTNPEGTFKTSGNKNKAILIFLLTLVTGSLAAVFWFRCQIFSGVCPPPCETTGVCPPPPPCETTESAFNGILSQGKNGISSFDNAKNIQEMKTAQVSLTKVINDLGNIRASCPFYKEVQNNRVMYQSQLLKMDAEIANEEKAKKLFDEASAVKPQIQGKIERAKTNADLEPIKDAKKLVEDAIKKLQTIPANRFIAKNADDLLNEYQDMLKDFDQQIQLGCVVGNLRTCIR